MRAALDHSFDLLWPPELEQELVDKVTSKPYLSERIPPEELALALAQIHAVAVLLPPVRGIPPAIGRDPKDDYLLAHADQANADVIVSGDEDLLSLRMYKGIWIMSSAEFVRDLDAPS